MHDYPLNAVLPKPHCMQPLHMPFFGKTESQSATGTFWAGSTQQSNSAQHTGTRQMADRNYSISVNPNASLTGLDIDDQLAILSEEAEALLSHFAADVVIEKIEGIGSHIHRNMKVATLRVSSLIGNDGIVDGYVRNAATRTAFVVTVINI
jgi:hypothetical protein